MGRAMSDKWVPQGEIFLKREWDNGDVVIFTVTYYDEIELSSALNWVRRTDGVSFMYPVHMMQATTNDNGTMGNTNDAVRKGKELARAECAMGDEHMLESKKHPGIWCPHKRAGKKCWWTSNKHSRKCIENMPIQEVRELSG